MKTCLIAFAAALPLLAAAPALAAPIEYVRVCDTFGAGYFYIPGTDQCINATTGTIKTETANGTVTTVSTQQQDILDTEAAAKNAQNTADGAQNSADDAQSSADRAQQSAATAQGTADRAQQSADQAQGTADRAQQSADEAQGTADNAQQSADHAEGSAGRAQKSANSAQDTANQALDASGKSGALAGHAMSAAEQAQMRADQAVDGVAISLAMQPAVVTQGHTYGLAFNAGTFGGSTALAVSGAFALNDNVTFNGAVGAALGSGEVAGRGGVNFSW